MTATDGHAMSAPRTTLSRDGSAELATAELAAFRRLLDPLAPGDWALPTANAGWTVKDVVAHVSAQFEEFARFDRLLRRLRAAKRRHPEQIAIDGHNSVQVTELAALTPAELLARLDHYVPAGIRAARRLPSLVRRLPSSLFFPGSPLAQPSLAYVFDILGTRDAWMHRLDIARAVGRPFELAGHDRVIVEQVMADLAGGWAGGGVELELTGEAGGSFTLTGAGPIRSVRVDAVELMLQLSGRSTGGVDGEALPGASVVF